MAGTMNSARQTAKRLTLVTAGAVLMAFNINTFVHAGGLIPGGFTGLTLLIKTEQLNGNFFKRPKD